MRIIGANRRPNAGKDENYVQAMQIEGHLYTFSVWILREFLRKYSGTCAHTGERGKRIVPYSLAWSFGIPTERPTVTNSFCPHPKTLNSILGAPWDLLGLTKSVGLPEINRSGSISITLRKDTLKITRNTYAILYNITKCKTLNIRGKSIGAPKFFSLSQLTASVTFLSPFC